MAKAIDAQTHISSLAQRYQQFGVDADRAVCQWRLSRNLFYDLTASASTVDSLSLNDACARIPTDFNDLRLLYKIAMTLPVTTASVERGFSKLSYIKNKLRSTMHQERLESLMLASVENSSCPLTIWWRNLQA